MLKSLRNKILKPFLPTEMEPELEEETVKQSEEVSPEEFERNLSILRRALVHAKKNKAEIKLDPTLGESSSRATLEKGYPLKDFDLENYCLTLELENVPDKGIVTRKTLSDIEEVLFHHISASIPGEKEDLKVWIYRKYPLGTYRMYIPLEYGFLKEEV